jgi:heme oxygenase
MLAGSSRDGGAGSGGLAGDRANLLAVLREQTRTEHQAIEQTLGLMSDALTGAEYRRTVERFHGFWKPIEARLRQIPALEATGIDLPAREKTPLLALDLRALDVEAPSDARLCRELPRVDSPAAALGCLYVIEGASLGGQVISRHLRARLDITPTTGGRFFHGYGERTGEMWRAFGAVVSGFPLTAGAEGEMVESAIATFRLFREWCELAGPPKAA